MEWRNTPRCFDLILKTVASPHRLDAFLALLKRDSAMTQFEAPATTHPPPHAVNLIEKLRCLAGWLIGSIPETQEMLDFGAEHGIFADTEMTRDDQISTAYGRMVKGDVKYRFAIAIASLAT